MQTLTTPPVTSHCMLTATKPVVISLCAAKANTSVPQPLLLLEHKQLAIARVLGCKSGLQHGWSKGPGGTSGATLGGRQRSRLSIGARALGTPPDPTQLLRPLHAAPPTPPLTASHPSSARAGPQPAGLAQGSQEAMEPPPRGLTVPYTQRLQTAGEEPLASP